MQRGDERRSRGSPTCSPPSTARRPRRRAADALRGGQSLAEYAAAHRISRETARTHLKALFGKTDCRRQGELVRLLSRLPSSRGIA